MERALSEGPRPGGKRKLVATEEALLIATACAQPPAGRARWTLALLAAEVVRLTPQTSISRATIGRRLAENDLKPWQEKMWCVPQIDATYVARMEDVLGLYTTRPRPGTAVVCVDETPQQVIGEVRTALPPVPGHPARHDYEYRRNGTANIFVAVDAHQPRRYTKVTLVARRSTSPSGCAISSICTTPGPSASWSSSTICRPIPRLRSTRRSRPPKPAACCGRLEFHYVPKHASWLNMVEIEIGILSAAMSRSPHPGRSPRSPPKSTRGHAPATRPARACAGCLALSKRAPNWDTPIRQSPARRPPRESVKISAMRYIVSSRLAVGDVRHCSRWNRELGGCVSGKPLFS